MPHSKCGRGVIPSEVRILPPPIRYFLIKLVFMNNEITRRILKELYREYKKSSRVDKFDAGSIFRELNIPDGTDLSEIHNNPYIAIDNKERFCLTKEGIEYMNAVYERYDRIAGLIKDFEFVNKDKEERSFLFVNHEIENKKKENIIQQQKEWYEKPVGTVIIGIIVAVVSGFILFKLGWL